MTRDPGLLAVLADRTSVGSVELEWQQPLRMTGYIGPADFTDELVTSIRVIVLVGDGVVVCTNRDGGSHVWPGGHREPGESFLDTACREVHEETGWILERESVDPIGFIHFENLGEPWPPYPFPDAVHLVMVGRAVERAAEEWTDTEGWEVASAVAPLHELGVEVEEMCLPFLEVLRARS